MNVPHPPHNIFLHASSGNYHADAPGCLELPVSAVQITREEPSLFSPLGPPIGTAAKYRLPSSSVSRWPRVWWNTIGFPDLLFARVVVEISVSRMRPVRVRPIHTARHDVDNGNIRVSPQEDRKGPGTEGLNASPANTAPAHERCSLARAS